MGKTNRKQKTEDRQSKRMFTKKPERSAVRNELNKLKRK